MDDNTNPTEIVAEAVREYVGDGDGADAEVLANYEQQIRDQIDAEIEAGKAVLESAGLRVFDGHLPGLSEHLARKVLIAARATHEQQIRDQIAAEIEADRDMVFDGRPKTSLTSHEHAFYAGATRAAVIARTGKENPND